VASIAHSVARFAHAVAEKAGLVGNIADAATAANQIAHGEVREAVKTGMTSGSVLRVQPLVLLPVR
jgi:hypothetical protein